MHCDLDFTGTLPTTERLREQQNEKNLSQFLSNQEKILIRLHPQEIVNLSRKLFEVKVLFIEVIIDQETSQLESKATREYLPGALSGKRT